MMLTYAVTLFCALALGLLVYRYDLYDREPWFLLLAAVAVGFAAMWGVGFLEDATNAAVAAEVAAQAAVAASHEEVVKLLATFLVTLLAGRYFNDPMDGVIYGAFVGLGAGLEESLMYLSISPAGLDTAATEAVRLILHMTWTAANGYALGLRRVKKRNWPLVLALCLALTMALHFLWDWYCGIATSPQAAPSSTQRFVSVLLMLLSLALFGGVVAAANRYSRQALAPNSRRQLWGWPFSRR